MLSVRALSTESVLLSVESPPFYGMVGFLGISRKRKVQIPRKRMYKLCTFLGWVREGSHLTEWYWAINSWAMHAFGFISPMLCA